MEEQKLREIIARNIAYYRKQAGHTQAELGEKLGYSDKSVSKWERGDGVPDIYVLSHIADLYGIHVSDLLDEKSPEKKHQQKILVWLLSVGLVWLVAVIFFFLLLLLAPDLQRKWLVFIWAIPVSFILSLIFSSLRHLIPYQVLSTSGILWGVTMGIHFTFMYANKEAFMLYIIAGVLQILTILWYILRYKKRKK